MDIGPIVCTYEEALKMREEVSKKCRDTFSNRPQSEQDDINLRRCRWVKKYSKAACNFFEKIISEIEHLNLKIYWKDDEYFLWDYENKKIYFYDFYIPELNIVIEYNGIMFHPRKADTIFVKVADSLEKDTNKERACRDRGIDFFVFWENIDDEITMANNFAEIIKNKYENTQNFN
jgi:hypothetical protein